MSRARLALLLALSLGCRPSGDSRVVFTTRALDAAPDRGAPRVDAALERASPPPPPDARPQAPDAPLAPEAPAPTPVAPRMDPLQTEPEQPRPGGLPDVPAQPVACTGDRVIYLDRVSIDNPTGPAVRASGGCAVRLSNCTLRGSVGVLASGRATVHLTRCRITGTTFALDASGNASVHLTRCALLGPQRQRDRATLDTTP